MVGIPQSLEGCLVELNIFSSNHVHYKLIFLMFEMKFQLQIDWAIFCPTPLIFIGLTFQIWLGQSPRPQYVPAALIDGQLSPLWLRI